MRIGMILDKTFPPDPRVENEAISLINAGHQVFLFCLKYNEGNEKEVVNKIELRRYQSNRFEYKLSALAYTVPFYTLLMKRKIKNFLKANSIEAIHVHDIRIAEAVFKVNEQFKLPVVLDLHDNMPEIMKLYPHVQKFPGKYLINPKKWKLKEEEFINKATKVITVSNEFKDEVFKRTNISVDKIVVVPNTVQQLFYTKFRLSNEVLSKYKNNFVVLYLGDTGLRRGLKTAIEATSTLKDKIPNIKLVIVGKNTTDSVLKSLAQDLGVLDYVDFEGWQDVDLFPTYIIASSVCISPLYRNIQHDVAYANKLFQYMSFGKPLLVSNATAQKNLVERIQSGLIHLEKDVLDFSDKLMKLFEDKELSEKLGANGKSFIKNEFHWAKTSTKLIDLYTNLAN